MRILKALALVAVAGALAAGSLQAQLPSGTGTFTWGGVNGANGYFRADNGSIQSLHRVSTNPYRGQFTVTTANVALWMLPPSGTTVDVFCANFFRAVNHTPGYAVNFVNLGDPNAAADIPLYTHNNGPLPMYLEAAYLAGQILAAGPANYQSDAVQDMAGAMWQIMTPGWTFYRSSDNGATYGNTGIQYYLGQAAIYGPGVDGTKWVVASTGRDDDTQDWLTHVTPEPATLLLLGTGLMGVLMAAGAFRRSAV